MMIGRYYLMRFFLPLLSLLPIPVCFLFYLDSLTDLPDLFRWSDMNMTMTSTCSRGGYVIYTLSLSLSLSCRSDTDMEMEIDAIMHA